MRATPLLALLLPLAGCSLALPFDQELPQVDAGAFELYPAPEPGERPDPNGCKTLCQTLVGCVHDEPNVCHFYAVAGDAELDPLQRSCERACPQPPPTPSQLDYVEDHCRDSAKAFVERNDILKSICTYPQDSCRILCKPGEDGLTAFGACTDLPGECEDTCLRGSAAYWTCVKAAGNRVCTGLRNCLRRFEQD